MYPRLALFSIFAALTLALISSVPQALAQDSNAKKTVAPRQSEKTGAGDVARGKYLVESVAVCGQCHTPRDSRGELDRSRWLQGAPVPWMPARPDSDWPLNPPP